MTATYATTAELAEFMNILDNTIDRTEGTTLEHVGTGDNDISVFVLKNGAVVGTPTLYYGYSENEALSQTLTETTHYTIDKDKGVITLTSAGKTLLDTKCLFADYEYNVLGITVSQSRSSLQLF